MNVVDLIQDYFLKKAVRCILDPLLKWVGDHTLEARRIGLLWVLYKTRRLGNARYQRRVEFIAICYAIPVLLQVFAKYAERHGARALPAKRADDLLRNLDRG